MNQQLLNPFGQDYPETVEATYQTLAQRCRFNPSGPYAGSLLALGGIDGSVEVFDMDTKGLIRSFQGHSQAIESLSWSRNNRYLLTASRDMRCIIHDLSFTTRNMPSSSSQPSSHISRIIEFADPVLNASFHPRTSKMILVTLANQGTVLVDLRGKEKRWELKDVAVDEENETGGVENGYTAMEVFSSANPKSRFAISAAEFHPSGMFIYAGTTNGTLLTIDVASRYVINRMQVATTTLKQLAFDRSGRNLVINSTDRAVRVVQVDPFAGLVIPLHRFQDLINRTPWNAVGFSGDGEYVMGGAGTKISHNIYIWDRAGGTLVKVLEGPKDSLDDCDWSTSRPTIASVTSAGMVNIWQTTVDESWSAFAPGFEELEENREYEEREDEFDIEDEEEAIKRKQAEEEQDIDVLLNRAQFEALFQPEADSGESATGINWRLEWADDDDRPDFFPHLDLQEDDAEGGEEEEKEREEVAL